MRVRDALLDFLNYVFLLGLIAFVLVYVVVGDRIEFFAKAMLSLMPLSYFGIIFLIKLKLSRRDLARRKREHDADLILRLTYFDKFKSDVLIFLLPIIILLISFFLKKEVDMIDTFQAAIAFLAMYLWGKYIFYKGIK